MMAYDEHAITASRCAVQSAVPALMLSHPSPSVSWVSVNPDRNNHRFHLMTSADNAPLVPYDGICFGVNRVSIPAVDVSRDS